MPRLTLAAILMFDIAVNSIRYASPVKHVSHHKHVFEDSHPDEGNSLHSLSSDLRNLFSEPESMFADLKIRCGNHVYPAHRFILAARSKFFFKEFQEECDDNQCGCNCDTVIEIEHYKQIEMDAFLRYIYTGMLPKSQNIKCKLCEIGGKYEVTSLIEECNNFINKCGQDEP